jgi:hypothetical protein
MEMKNPFGAPVRTRRFSHSTRLPSIRYATVLGGLRAFALLWAVSMRANADVPSVRTATPRALVAEAARPAAALAARDASGQGVPPGKGVHFQNQVAARKLKAKPAIRRRAWRRDRARWIRRHPAGLSGRWCPRVSSSSFWLGRAVRALR